MIMDNQHRLTIPQNIRKMCEIESGKEYYLILEGNREFLLIKECEGRIIDKVKLDDKGRFYIPRSIIDIFAYKKVIMYCKEGKVGITIFKEDA